MQQAFRASPRVVTVGTEVEVKMRGGEPDVLTPGRDVTVRFFSKVDRRDDAAVPARVGGDGALRVRLTFRARGEYTLDVRAAGEDNTENNKTAPLLSGRFFAAGAETARLRPRKGDVHLHTSGSDGRDAPADMLVAARRAGMDYAAITDHDNHAPSRPGAHGGVLAGTGFLALQGEEATIPERGGHVVALNTVEGVGPRRAADEAVQARERMAATFAGRALVSPLTPTAYAHAAWTVREVRRAGGLALMAHPYWEGSRGKFYPPRCIFEQLLADGLLDGVELIGGSPATEGNLLCVAKYAEEIAAGRRWAVVGGSDAHRSDEVGRKFTIVFAEGWSARAVVDAIAGRRSVACDAELGPAVAVFGPFELVEYAYFLLREYFPEHDRLCARQAALWAAGGAGGGEDDRAGAAAAVERELTVWRAGFFGC